MSPAARSSRSCSTICCDTASGAPSSASDIWANSCRRCSATDTARMELVYSFEQTALGTGGALRNAAALVARRRRARDERRFVLRRRSARAEPSASARTGRPQRIAVLQRSDRRQSGAVTLDPSGLRHRLRKPTRRSDAGPDQRRRLRAAPGRAGPDPARPQRFARGGDIPGTGRTAGSCSAGRSRGVSSTSEPRKATMPHRHFSDMASRE